MDSLLQHTSACQGRGTFTKQKFTKEIEEFSCFRYFWWSLTESNCEDLYFWENGREGQKLLWGDPELQKCWSGNWPVWWWRSEPALRGRVWSPHWVTRSRSLHHWSPHPCCLPGKIGNPRGGLQLRAPRLRPLITHTPTSLRHCPPVCPFTGSVFLATSWSFFEI